MKRKELLWMLLPCLLLAGAAIYFQKARQRPVITVVPTPSPLPLPAPLQFRIASIKQDSLSINEIAAGYDTRFLVTVLQGRSLKQGAKSLYLLPGAENLHLVNSKGERLSNVRLRYEVNGKVATGILSPNLEARRDETRLAFSVPLSRISPSEGTITLKGHIRGMVCDEQVSTAPMEMTVSRSTVSTKKEPQPLPLVIPLGKAGRTQPKAKAIQPCPLRLKRSEIKISNNVGAVVEIEVEYKRPAGTSERTIEGTPIKLPPKSPRFTFEETHIVDATGKEFPLAPGMGFNSFSANVGYSRQPAKNQTTTHPLTLSVQTRMMPRPKGKQVLKTLISADGCWPLAYSQQISPAPKQK